MQKITSKTFIKEVLAALKEKNISATKIFLHKFVYFLTLQNHVKLFKFEPYTYGPFSFNLAREIESLIFWDEVTVNGKALSLVDEKNSDINTKRVDIIKQSLNDFIEIAGTNYSFDNLERIGTVLYCMEALKNQNIDINLAKITEEFKGWKGNKYSTEQIEEAFRSISSHLPASLQ